MGPREQTLHDTATQDAGSHGTGSPGAGALEAASRKEEALWLLEQLEPDSKVNNVPGAAVRVDGRLDQRILQDVATALARRHPPLRTVFHDQGTMLLREVLPPEDAVLPLESRTVPSEGVDAALRELVARPFKLDGSPLVRMACLSTADGDVLCLAVHHLVFDNTSSTVFLHELAAAYDVALSGQDLKSLPVDEVPLLQEAVPDAQSLAFWREHLSGLDPAAGELWIGQRPAGSGTLSGDRRTLPLSPASVQLLKEAPRKLRAQDAVVLLAAYYLLLARHGAGPDFAVGLPVNIRGQQAQRTIGYHVNILPLRVQVDARRGFREFVREVRDTFLEAVAHADAPVDVLLLEAPRIASTWRSSLFRHVFNYLPGGGTREYRIGGLPGRMETVETGSSKFDLEFVILPSEDGFSVKAVYSTDVHSPEEIELLLRRYDDLLTAVAADPELTLGELPVWCETDREAIGAAATEDVAAGDTASLVARIAAHVAATPNAVAVQEPFHAITYAQVWRAAEATRDLLREQGVGSEDVVGISAPPGGELIAAALGAWLAGAGYAALDEDADTTEINAVEATIVLASDRAARVRAAAQAAGINFLSLAHIDHSADPALTAASTPAPAARGCACVLRDSSHPAFATPVTHHALAIQVGQIARLVGEDAQAGVDALWRAPLSSPAGLLEAWLPLATGGRLEVLPDDAALAGALDAAPQALLQARPGAWWSLLGMVEGRLAGRPVLVGPGTPGTRLAERLIAAGARPFALAGGAVVGGWWGAAAITGAGDGPVLGSVRPLPGLRIAITAPDGHQLPIGVRGEISLGPDEVEAESSQPATHEAPLDPTGFVGRWTSQGTIEVLGETRRAIRRRGSAVRPEAIENLLARHPGVAAAAVVAAFPDGPARVESDGPALVAVVQRMPGLRQDDPLLLDALRDLAGAELAAAATPDRFVVVSDLPAHRDGSLDHEALVELAAQALAESQEAEAGGDAEDGAAGPLPLLVALWQELIGRGDLHAGSNFFSSGGHSLLAAQLVQRVEEQTGVRLSLADAFEHPTPSALATRIAAAARAAAASRTA